MTSPLDLSTLNTRGRWPPPDGPRVAIVGSRRPSPYGEAVAEQLAADLARAGVIVISGLALGCDAAAHRGALVGGGVTVAVMGTGVDIVYPAAHFRLAEEIVAAGGALVSQFPDGTSPRRRNFPARNVTLAALSDVVVVVEAVQGSGALITAEAALDLHKEVMAVPGSIFSHLSDVLAVSTAELARKLHLPVAEVLGRLTSLELDGAVRRHGAGYVRALRTGKD